MALQDELRKGLLGCFRRIRGRQAQILDIYRPGGKGQPWGRDDLAPQCSMPNVI